jgi:putative transposase
MDFVSDDLFNGKYFRVLTVVDVFTRECLAIHADQDIKGEVVAIVMERFTSQHRTAPTKIRMNNGPVFIYRALDQWAYMNKVRLNLSRPENPKDNAFVDSFNGRFRDECLNTRWFLLLDDAQGKIETWRRDLAGSCPHTTLGFMKTAEIASSAGVTLADERSDLLFWADTNQGQG